MNKIKFLIIPAVILALVTSLIVTAALAPSGAWAKHGSGNENPGEPPGWGGNKLVGNGPGNSGGSPGHTQENPGNGGSDPPGPGNAMLLAFKEGPPGWSHVNPGQGGTGPGHA